MNKVTFSGALTIYEVLEAKNTLLAVLEQATGMEIDLTDVSELDTAGVQVLVAIRREAARRGLDLRIRHGSASKEVFDCYRLGA